MFESCNNHATRSRGETGIRSDLKNRGLMACGFESHREYWVIAQPVEQLTHNKSVTGSSPVSPTKPL